MVIPQCWQVTTRFPGIIVNLWKKLLLIQQCRISILTELIFLYCIINIGKTVKIISTVIIWKWVSQICHNSSGITSSHWSWQIFHLSSEIEDFCYFGSTLSSSEILWNEVGSFLPLDFFEKFNSEMLSASWSVFGNHFIPLTRMDLPLSVRLAGGSWIPENMTLFDGSHHDS